MGWRWARFVCVAVWLGVGGAARALEGEIEIAGPPGSASFGEEIVVLPNGNLVVVDSDYGLTVTRQGAVHLYDGATLELISTLRGSSAFDGVGSDGVTVLSDGDFVVRSSGWDDPVNALVDAGAATLCSGTTGCSGEVSAANSLVGGAANNLVGRDAVLALSNGNYVVGSAFWDLPAPPTSNVGAATFCNGTTGCTGVVSPANSLTGTTADDRVGGNLVALQNAAYLVWANAWDAPGPPAVANVGAVVRCPATGCTGVVSAANALVGGTAQDAIGSPVVLPNGNYVVRAQSWDRPAPAAADAGAATFCNGTTGCTGLVSAANSLVGASAMDFVPSYVLPLATGHYVIGAPSWTNPTGPVANVGAVLWCDGTTGCAGEITPANSLVGARDGDLVGTISPGAVALADGGYAVMSPFWDNPAPVVTDVGAVTRCPGTAGGCAGIVVAAANSLIGSTAVDRVGFRGMQPLANAGYVVDSPFWDHPAPLRIDVGASTLCAGTTGCAGQVVSAANSLVGSTANDTVGDDKSVALANGDYVVIARQWNRLSPAVVDAGAVVRCSGTTGCTGEIDDAAALVGTNGNDRVGVGGVFALATGAYLVQSPNAGAVSFCAGAAGCTGEIDAENSLVGATSDDGVGEEFPYIDPTGAYVLVTPSYDDPLGASDVGAATLGFGQTGVVGVIGAANSVIGAKAQDVESALYDPVRRRLLVGRPRSNAITVPEPGALTAGLAVLAALAAALRAAR